MFLIINKFKIFINNIQNQLTVYALLMMPETDSLTTAVHVVDDILVLS